MNTRKAQTGKKPEGAEETHSEYRTSSQGLGADTPGSAGSRCEGDLSAGGLDNPTVVTGLRQRNAPRTAAGPSETSPRRRGSLEQVPAMINRSGLAQQGAAGGAVRWQNSVDPEMIGGDDAQYSKTGKPRGHNTARHRLVMYLKTNKAKAAFALLVSIGAAAYLIFQGSSAMSEASKEARHREDKVWNERRVALELATNDAKQEVSKLRKQFRMAQENVGRARGHAKKMELALEAARRDEQRIQQDGKMKMAAQQKKDERIARATHKTIAESSLPSDLAAKRIRDEQWATAKKEVVRTRKEAERGKAELQTANAMKNSVNQQLVEAEAALKKVSDELRAHWDGAEPSDLPGTVFEPAGEGARDGAEDNPRGSGLLDEGQEGAVEEDDQGTGEEAQMLEGEEEEEEERGAENEGVVVDRQAVEAEQAEPREEEPLKELGQDKEALENSVLDEDVDGEADEAIKEEEEEGGALGQEDAVTDEAVAAADEILQEAAESRAAQEGARLEGDEDGQVDKENEAGELRMQQEEAVERAKREAQAQKAKINRRMGLKDPLPKRGQQQLAQGSTDSSPLRHASQRPSVLDEDESVRCRTSQICEGPDACKRSADKTLACITDTTARRDRVRDAAKWAWQGYKKYAWGQDELHPLSGTSGSWFDLGLTLVDSLDTLLLMGLEEEYADGREWVANSLRLDSTKTDVNLFETTIRVLGGLLSVYNLTNDRVYLDKATDLGQRLLPAFNTKSGVPLSDINLKQRTAHGPKWGTDSSTSETTTLYLEFSYLSYLTGDPTYREKASQVLDVVGRAPGRIQGLVPIMINPDSGTFRGNTITLGARGDSYYEYLLKCYIISERRDQRCLRMYQESMRGVRELLVDVTSSVGGLMYIGEIKTGAGREIKSPKMDHLVCFMPGLLALGHYHGVETSAEGEMSDLELAEELARTCYAMYRYSPAGLAPEIVHFTKHSADYPKQHKQDIGDGHFQIKTQDSHNLLRPETVESLYILYKVTGDPVYREHAWLIFRAFEKHTRVSRGGYASLDSVLTVPAKQRDKMESFWIAETLKYLYLIFEERDLIPFDSYVLNTEAHPLPIHQDPDSAASGSNLGQGPSRSLMQRRRLSTPRSGSRQTRAEQQQAGLAGSALQHEASYSQIVSANTGSKSEDAGDEDEDDWLSPEEYEEEADKDSGEERQGLMTDEEQVESDAEKEEGDAWDAAEEEQAHLYEDDDYDDHEAGYDVE